MDSLAKKYKEDTTPEIPATGDASEDTANSRYPQRMVRAIVRAVHEKTGCKIAYPDGAWEGITELNNPEKPNNAQHRTARNRTPAPPPPRKTGRARRAAGAEKSNKLPTFPGPEKPVKSNKFSYFFAGQAIFQNRPLGIPMILRNLWHGDMLFIA